MSVFAETQGKHMSVFAEVLGIRPKDVEKPEPLPVGTYQATVVGFPTQEEVGKNKTPALKFKMTGVIPIDVNPTELAKVEDISKHEIVHTLFLTDKSLHRLKKFLDVVMTSDVTAERDDCRSRM